LSCSHKTLGNVNAANNSTASFRLLLRGWLDQFVLFSFYFGGSQTAWQQVSMPGSEATGYDERGSRYLIIDILEANQSTYKPIAKTL
jgi:hypothetical protein